MEPGNETRAEAATTALRMYTVPSSVSEVGVVVRPEQRNPALGNDSSSVPSLRGAEDRHITLFQMVFREYFQQFVFVIHRFQMRDLDAILS